MGHVLKTKKYIRNNFKYIESGFHSKQCDFPIDCVGNFTSIAMLLRQLPINSMQTKRGNRNTQKQITEEKQTRVKVSRYIRILYNGQRKKLKRKCNVFEKLQFIKYEPIPIEQKTI